MDPRYRFISIARHTGGEKTVSVPDVEIRQLAAIELTETAFELIDTIQTLRLYRVHPQTLEPVHVQTWTRKTVEV